MISMGCVKLVYTMGRFPAWESFQVGHKSCHFTFPLGLEKSNGFFWQLKSDQGDTEQKPRESLTPPQSWWNSLSWRTFPQEKKKGWMLNCHQWSEEFYLIISAPQLQRSLMHVGWAKEWISHLSLRNPQSFGKGHILKADHTKVCKTHSYKTNKFTA